MNEELEKLGKKVMECSYGENPWQARAEFYSLESGDRLALDKFELVTGAPPTYNNLCEIDRQLQTMTHIAAGLHEYYQSYTSVPLIAIGTKHGNCCGAAIGPYSSTEAGVLTKMIEGDSLALFGGLIMVNFKIDEELAETILYYLIPPGQSRLLDGITAPGFTAEAIEMLRRKKDKCRLFANRHLSGLGWHTLDEAPRFRYVRGGFLVQSNYKFVLDLRDPDIEQIGPALTNSQWADLVLAWAVGSTSNSNTITVVRDGQLLANAVGQQDRYRCCKLAVQKARDSRHSLSGAVAYSDSFFPFADGPTILIVEGISAVLASRGSVRDQEVRDAFRDKKVSFITVPNRKIRGFFGH